VRRIFAAVLLGCSLPVHAVDSVSAEYGVGTHEVSLWRLGLQWKAPPFDWMEKHSRWSWYWDVSIGGFHGDEGTVHDFGVTPVFRYMKAAHGAYLEGGIGAHIFSDSHINSDLGFSTRFQFGDHLAAGYQARKWDGQLRLQHLSNGGMKNPNPGINFLILRVQRWLD
jgi:lipid A 3-O-deacylase